MSSCNARQCRILLTKKFFKAIIYIKFIRKGSKIVKAKRIHATILSMAISATGCAYATKPEEDNPPTAEICNQTRDLNIGMYAMFNSIVYINDCPVQVKILRSVYGPTRKGHSMRITTDNPKALSEFTGIDETSCNKTFFDNDDEQNGMWYNYTINNTIRKLTTLPQKKILSRPYWL